MRGLIKLQRAAGRRASLPPAAALLMGAVACLLIAALVTREALRTPWLGLELVAMPSTGEVQIIAAEGPSRGLPSPAVLETIGRATDDGRVSVVSDDRIEDPDMFDRYEQMSAFFARQAALSEILAAPKVVVRVRLPDSSRAVHVISPGRRPLGSLPIGFWFQLATGFAGVLFGLWVLAFRPRDWGARMFAILSVMFPLSAFTAAIYSSRELAIDGALFHRLHVGNQIGGLFFGVALMGLFLLHPRRLIRPRNLWPLLPLAAALLVWDTVPFAPDVDWGLRVPLLLMLVAGLSLAAVQWRLSRDDPRARASLRYLGLSILVGGGLFLAFITTTSLVGELPSLPQAYAFGFFLLMDAGLALGLRRHRLLGLDEWTMRVLVWVGGALLLILIDVVLISTLRTHPAVSLPIALLLCAFLYLPLRNWIWSRTVLGRPLDVTSLFQGVLDITFASSAQERSARWMALLRSHFEPMEIRALSRRAGGAVRLERQGLRLYLPAIASLPAVRISYPWRGRGLFGPRDQQLAQTLVALMEQAGSTREASLKGAREERLRIARDLHDNLGASLLSGLYEEALDETREAIRHSLSQMRAVVNELSGRELSLEQALAEMRYETQQRAEAAGLELVWRDTSHAREGEQMMLTDAVLHGFTAMVRELVTNVIRHASATKIEIQAEQIDTALHLSVRDDGVGIGGASPGNGLPNLRRRAGELGGTVHFRDLAPGTCVELVLPLAAKEAA